MEAIITSFLSNLRHGQLQTFKNMSIIPLSSPADIGPEHAPLKEAMDRKLLTITEVNQGGSVPELKVINTSPLSVFLLDGEELMGAKQNRVLNTSILLGGRSETIIPVSCTEQGRWSYSSAEFAHSNIIMSRGVRASKGRSVSSSLRTRGSYASDQGRVWGEIAGMHRKSRTSSATGAMRDVYTAKAEDLGEYLQAFEYVPQQQGSLVFINGQLVGFDIISRKATYRALHPKLVESYAIDALLAEQDSFDEASVEQAKNFFQEIQSCEESRFDSVGLGYDYRFDGENAVGSALVFEQSVIHLAFFKLPQNEREQTDRMSRSSQRRAFRNRR